MGPAETLEAIDKSQLKVEVVDNNLHISPLDSIPPDLIEAIKQNKEEIADMLTKTWDWMDVLPFPLGFKGLPTEQVIASLAWSDSIGHTDPIDRTLNVLAWLLNDEKFSTHPLYQGVVEKINYLWEEEYGYKYIEDDELDGKV